jgi:DNA glycosylase AlkZ-like
LTVGEPFSHAETRVASKLGVTEKEIDKLCDAVIKALAKGPLAPDEIRDATGSASRNLGEEGKKKGMVTTLPLAFGRLQVTGDIRRIPMNGRLDQQRYQYTIWRQNPLKNFKLSPDEANVELARRYFRWIGPATLSEFQQFAGLNVKETKATVEPMKLVPVENGSDRLMFAEDLEKFQSLKVPGKPQYALVSGIDSLALHRRDLTLLLDPKDRTNSMLKAADAKPGGGLFDLPDHAILDRGRVIGLWEYDVESESIIWTTFGVKDKALNAVVEETRTYVREQLGDARSFSLDSPKSRIPRIQILRKAAGK